MRYLHGDSSPFPLNENFLETLANATDACVGLLHADVALEHARQATEHADTVVAKELARIDSLAAAIADAVQGQGAEPNSMTEAAAIRIAELSHAAIEDARRGVADWREETVAQANASVPDVMSVLATFLVRHQLPNTQWGLQWRAGLNGGPARAQVHAVTMEGLNATFEVHLPMEHLWALPVRVATLEKTAVIQLVRKGFFSGPRPRDEHLDRYFVTHVTHTPERIAMTLSKSAREPSEGLEIQIRTGDRGGLCVMPVDAEGRPAGEVIELVGEAAAIVQRIWERVETTIADLLWYRKELRVATLQGTPIKNLRHPADIARIIVESIAPVVRDLRRHSRSSTELTLKRDLGDGRREELFIPHHEILAKLSGLAPHHRALFDAYGLEDPPDAYDGRAKKRKRVNGFQRVA